MMFHHLGISFVLVSLAAGGTLRAATKPRAVPASEANVTWTNEDLERLNRIPGLISVVGQPTNVGVQDIDAPAPQSITEDPAWYAEQAGWLNARLETEQADLRDFTQALDDARELKSTTSGVGLFADDIGITPEATIDILQNRVRATQSELDALEDLARRNDIPSGIFRDQWQGILSDTTIKEVEQSQRDMSTRGGDL